MCRYKETIIFSSINQKSWLNYLVSLFLGMLCCTIFCSCLCGGLLPGGEVSTTLPNLTDMIVGTDGVWKCGFWTPVTVKYSGDFAKLEVEAFDSDGTPTFVRADCSDPKGIQRVYLPLGRANGNITIRFLDQKNNAILTKTFVPEERKNREEEAVKRPSFCYRKPENPQRPIFLILGDNNIGLSEAITDLRIPEIHRPLLRRITDIKDLPDKWYGYDAIAQVILTTTDPEIFKGVTKDDIHLKALAEWVRYGGKVVLLAGRNSIPYITGNGPLLPFLPGKAEQQTREVRIANSIVRSVPKAKNLVMTGSLDAPFLEMPVLYDLNSDSKVEMIEMETPVLIRTPIGFGLITWFASDLSQAPLSKWSGRSGLVSRIFDYDSEKNNLKSSDGKLIQRGYSDLSGQIRSALDRFDNVMNIPFSIILLFICLYILLIGPFDWYFTHRLLKKPNLTWITFPVYILLFCGLAFFIGNISNPDGVRINQVDLIDIDQQTGMVCGSSWNGLYSHWDASYNIHLDTSFKPNDSKNNDSKNNDSKNTDWKYQSDHVLFSWLGLQGSALGGMDPKTISPQFWTESYQLGSPATEMTGIPVKIHSTKSLYGRWTGLLSNFKKSELAFFDGIPRGTVENPFSVPLENTFLFYGRWAFDLGTLPPEGKKVDLKTPRMESHLVIGTSKDPFGDASHSMIQQGLAKYDVETSSIPYILRTVMFYRLAGGFPTIGLENTGLQYLDFSHLIAMDRAVLVGTIADSDTNKFPLRSEMIFTKDDQKVEEMASNHSVFVRIVLPVKHSKTN